MLPEDFFVLMSRSVRPRVPPMLAEPEETRTSMVPLAARPTFRFMLPEEIRSLAWEPVYSPTFRLPEDAVASIPSVTRPIWNEPEDSSARALPTEPLTEIEPEDRSPSIPT